MGLITFFKTFSVLYHFANRKSLRKKKNEELSSTRAFLLYISKLLLFWDRPIKGNNTLQPPSELMLWSRPQKAAALRSPGKTRFCWLWVKLYCSAQSNFQSNFGFKDLSVTKES